jgi:hypothetical protein
MKEDEKKETDDNDIYEMILKQEQHLEEFGYNFEDDNLIERPKQLSNNFPSSMFDSIF